MLKGTEAVHCGAILLFSRHHVRVPASLMGWSPLGFKHLGFKLQGARGTTELTRTQGDGSPLM